MKKLVTIIVLLFAISVTSNAQNFTFHRVGPALVTHDTTSFYPVVLKGVFTNTSATYQSFKFIRIVNNLPDTTWSSQMCVGSSCYPSFLDTIPPGGDSINLSPGASDTLFIDVLGHTQGLGTIVMKVFLLSAPTQSVVDTFKIQLNATNGIRNISSTVKDYELSQNFPNPFNPSTVIHFSLSKNQRVSLKIYNTLGMEVANLLNDENLTAGSYAYDFNANAYKLPSGIYFYRLRTDNFSDVKKMVLTK
jgi:hypothetical protein